MTTSPKSGRHYLPVVADPGGRLRPQLDKIVSEEGPDVTLADVIRKFIRAGIKAHNEGRDHEQDCDDPRT